MLKIPDDINVWMISDTHFYHKRIIEYCERPFESIQEMNETLHNNCCLLYTSPSPRDRQKSRMPSSA